MAGSVSMDLLQSGDKTLEPRTQAKAKNRQPIDFVILITLVLLLTLGLIMVLSSSSAYAYGRYDDSLYFVKKQLMFSLIGILSMLVTMNLPYAWLGKYSRIMLGGSILLLVMVLLPGIGKEINGAQRWMLGFQPSEIAKIGLILFPANSLSIKKGPLKRFFKDLVPYMLLVGVIAGLLFLEPHKSAILIIGLVSGLMFFLAGMRLSHIAIMLGPVVALATGAVYFHEYSRARVMTVFDPFLDKMIAGYQAVQSLLAIGSGGLFGRGFGRSIQKLFYIPEPCNDFILSVLAEELGFVGVVAVFFLFALLIYRGIKVAMRAPDVFGSLAAAGITALVAVQFIINVAVVTSTFPVTGMPLPFFSYGGSSLLFLMISMGILLNISRYANYERL